jgi:hypothetical protein
LSFSMSRISSSLRTFIMLLKESSVLNEVDIRDRQKKAFKTLKSPFVFMRLTQKLQRFRNYLVKKSLMLKYKNVHRGSELAIW